MPGGVVGFVVRGVRHAERDPDHHATSLRDEDRTAEVAAPGHFAEVLQDRLDGLAGGVRAGLLLGLGPG